MKTPPAGGETAAEEPLADALLFSFSGKHQHRHEWLLPVMITASLVLHGLLFYLVQAANPIPRAQIFPSARVAVLNAGETQDQQLMQWINDHDPAGLARHSVQIDPPVALTELTFEPGFAEHQPALLPIAREAAPATFPPVAAPGPVPLPPRSGNAALAAIQAPTRSVLRLIPEIAFVPASVAFQPPLVQQIPPPTRFLVQISSEGGLEEAFLQNSSGDAALDRYALSWLQGGRFDLAGKSAEPWFDAIFIWGSEVFSPAQR